jgi:hypothetical protein
MTWLWLLVPILLLGAAVALWRTTQRLERQRDDLEDQLTALRADGPDPGHR